MVFSSTIFVFTFLPVTLILYFLAPRFLKNPVMLLCSLVFYAWGEPVYIFLMLFCIVFNYVMGLEMEMKKNEGKSARFSFIFSVAVNLGVLGFFKYYGFLLENINRILPFDIPYKELALPIGISFYTFQTLSYIIDVYRDKVEAQHNLISFGMYVSMFPQLIAGPIVKYTDVDRQLRERTITLGKFGEGVTYFLRGLGKKVLLANNIGMAFDAIAALPGSETSVLTAWIGCAAYTFQIYYDFGGYSDMAIGLGKMFGFDFLKNFDYPYISQSITEFWRRWHISLSSWFREYVYIPLGGNRVGALKHLRNIMIVWLLTGFWHGAAWNFMFWGVYYGVLLILEKYVWGNVVARLPKILRHCYAMILVMLGWVFFFSPSMGSAVSYIGTMFGIGGNGFIDSTGLYYLFGNLILFIIMIVCAGPGFYKRLTKYTLSGGRGRIFAMSAGYAVMLIVVIAYLVNATYNPFLYFRF